MAYDTNDSEDESEDEPERPPIARKKKTEPVRPPIMRKKTLTFKEVVTANDVPMKEKLNEAHHKWGHHGDKK